LRLKQTSFGVLVRHWTDSAKRRYLTDHLDIFKPNDIEILIHPAQIKPLSMTNDLDIYFSLREKSRFFLQTGTDVGNAEGSAYGNMRWRNIFGGAETLNLNASLGTRTRFAYQASLDTPFLSNPNFRGEIGGLASSTQKPWSSHEEVVKGGWAKLRWIGRGGGRHELGYHGVWRQITGLASNASPTVRESAGDSVKSSVSHTWVNDQRDYTLLPSRGYYTKIFSELAGWGPLKGDVAFWKSEFEAQGAVPIPIPGVEGNSGVSFTSGLRAGILYPLPLGFDSNSTPSRLNDRFQIGGPTDVRGFRLSGLGPRDGSDALGGDVYAAGSANLLVPIPRVGPHKPFRFQAFVNGGRLLALKQAEKNEDGRPRTVSQNVYSTVAELGNGLPSMSAGVGLVYAHPAARFELNFSLPLIIRQGEEGRKGLQFGIGINML
jgi:outer membrane protein insertion porin family